MKQLKFKTSKGEFFVLDMPLDVVNIRYGDDGIWVKYEDDKKYTPFSNVNCMLINSIKQITEEQASEIVDDYKKWFKNYSHKEDTSGGQRVSVVVFPYHKRAVDSLYSLLESKGIHLFENPQGNEITCSEAGDYHLWSESEQKTFCNPYIFKL